MHGGKPFVAPAAYQALLRRSDGLAKRDVRPGFSRLSAREREVLSMVAGGVPNKQVARQLDISVRTVESHRQHIMEKLNIHNAVGLTRFAISNGLVDLGQS